MPKTLFLCRHADTLEAAAGQTDFDRKLSPVGIQEAQKAAHWIKDFNLPIEAIYCSAAVRTTETARLLANDLSFSLEAIVLVKELYNTSVAGLVQFINQVNQDLNSVVVVSHNPAVSEFVTRLKNENQRYVPTGGVNYFKFKTDDWTEVEFGDFTLSVNY